MKIKELRQKADRRFGLTSFFSSLLRNKRKKLDRDHLLNKEANRNKYT